MRVLTVRQPWAALIVAGVKDVENRTWTPASFHEFDEPLLIHAGAAGAPAASPDWKRISASADVRSAIIGCVRVVDIVRDSPSRWARPDQFHWQLTDAVRFDEPIPCRGHLGLWTPEWELGPAVLKRLKPSSPA